jgi:hypothetical protein
VGVLLWWLPLWGLVTVENRTAEVGPSVSQRR